MEGGEANNNNNNSNKDEKLPAGFRFHPSDEELITCYLMHKISDANFTGRAIGDVDLNKCEPWDLPGKAKMGEKEFYFFSQRDRKYPTGVRTNRATNTGYWKTTGKDKEIYKSASLSSSSELIGMKKTLVFYKGRAPRGEKSNWVMHEYRIHSISPFRINTKQDEWVVCRVFQKSGGGKKYTSSNHHSRPSTTAAAAAAVAMNMSYHYNMNLENHPMQQQMIVNHHHPPPADHTFQFPAAAATAIRNYGNMTSSEIQELNKQVLMITSSSNPTTNLIDFPIPPLLNYGTTNNNVGPGFTISGLNLNRPHMRSAAAAAPPPMHDQHGAPGYGGDHINTGNNNNNNNNNNNRFVGTMDQCADMDNYWPSY